MTSKRRAINLSWYFKYYFITIKIIYQLRKKYYLLHSRCFSRIVASKRQIKTLASVSFFVFAVYSYHKQPKYLGREFKHGQCLGYNFSWTLPQYKFILATALFAHALIGPS